MTLINTQRARRCAHALTTYCDDDLRTNLVDFLTDAMHWCDQNDEDFDAAVNMARMHFEAECEEDHGSVL